MTPRIARLEADLEKNREARKALGVEHTRLLGELSAAKLDYAKDNPHPWLGRKVKRTLPNRGCIPGKTQRGSVVMYDPALHRGVRNYTPGPGEAFVLTASKLTAYRLMAHGGSEWELDL